MIGCFSGAFFCYLNLSSFFIIHFPLFFADWLYLECASCPSQAADDETKNDEEKRDAVSIDRAETL